MESNDKLKEVDIKNHWCYYFDDTIRIEDFDFNKIIGWKITWNILGLGHFIKSVDCCKPLYIRFNKVDGFIRDYDGTRHLVSFGPEKYAVIYNRIRYLIK